MAWRKRTGKVSFKGGFCFETALGCLGYCFSDQSSFRILEIQNTPFLRTVDSGDPLARAPRDCVQIPPGIGLAVNYFSDSCRCLFRRAIRRIETSDRLGQGPANREPEDLRFLTANYAASMLTALSPKISPLIPTITALIGTFRVARPAESTTCRNSPLQHGTCIIMTLMDFTSA